MKIKFEEVSKKFGDLVALDEVSFKIKPGEFIFITGKSGVGKSTLLDLVLGELKPTSGDIYVGELHLNKAKPKELLSLRRQMGVIYQDYRLLEDKTVRENILVALDVVGRRSDDANEKLEGVLETVGLLERVDMFPRQLSKGELQRVCLARALIIEPKILLADEPTGNLDPESGWQLVNLLKEVNEKGTTVVMATHDFDIVNSMKQRVIKLDKGKLISDKEEGEYE